MKNFMNLSRLGKKLCFVPRKNLTFFSSATIKVPNLQHEVQYIFIQGLNPQAPVEEQLEPITDLPSCVSYKVTKEGEKKFIVPKKGEKALITKIIPKDDICPSRMEKYEKRGYQFV